MNALRLAIVSCGFLGLSPFAPGTVGTLGGVVLVLLLGLTGHFLVASLVACVALYAIGRSLGEWSEAYGGRKDPGFFVLDEVIGYVIACLWIRPPSPLAMVLAFFAFRFFDVLKPYPAHRLQHLPGGDGILLDDVVAGFYAFLVVAVARLLLLQPESWVL